MLPLSFASATAFTTRANLLTGACNIPSNIEYIPSRLGKLEISLTSSTFNNLPSTTAALITKASWSLANFASTLAGATASLLPNAIAFGPVNWALSPS